MEMHRTLGSTEGCRRSVRVLDSIGVGVSHVETPSSAVVPVPGGRLAQKLVERRECCGQIGQELPVIIDHAQK